MALSDDGRSYELLTDDGGIALECLVRRLHRWYGAGDVPGTHVLPPGLYLVRGDVNPFNVINKSQK